MTKDQLRANRRHALNAWLSGGDGNRWSGDDGRAISLDDVMLMRIALLEGNLAPATATKYQAVVDAETTKFATLDVVYEAAKLAAGL